VFEAMQLGLQALGPAHGKRNSGHRIFPKKQNPGSMRSRGGDQDSIVVKVGGKCKPQKKKSEREFIV
jgi:hypothetical protein